MTANITFLFYPVAVNKDVTSFPEIVRSINSLSNNIYGYLWQLICLLYSKVYWETLTVNIISA